MQLKEIIEAIEGYMAASLCVNDRSYKKAVSALEELRRMDWTPIYDGDGKLPEVDEDGYSDNLLVSFANANIIAIGQYRQDENGDGSFYDGDLTETFADYGLIVNAWRPMPEPYREDEA